MWCVYMLNQAAVPQAFGPKLGYYASQCKKTQEMD